MLSIVPYGIETIDKYTAAEICFSLSIVPYGIETPELRDIPTISEDSQSYLMELKLPEYPKYGL